MQRGALVVGGGEENANAPFLYRRGLIPPGMLRASFLFIVFVGVISSGLSNCGSTDAVRQAAAASAERTISVGADQSDEDASASFQQASGAALTLKREWDGHFYADTQINGASIRML